MKQLNPYLTFPGKDGKIIMPLANKFSMLADKFGIQWMLSCRHE